MSDDKRTESIAVSEDIKMKTPSSESKFKWSDRQVELLISEWAKEPCLYDTTHEDYSKSDKRLNIERRIVATLNENANPEERLITVTDLKKKMNGLRTYHRTLWKKRNDIGAIDEITPCWQHYDQLMFLNDHFQPRETMVNMPKRKLIIDERETTENNDDDRQSEIEYICNANNHTEFSTKSRRLLKPNHEDEVVRVQERASATCSRKETNPEMMFGELVGHSLSNIKDERSREYAKLQIQQILFTCRYPETDPQKFSHVQPTSSVDEVPLNYTD